MTPITARIAEARNVMQHLIASGASLRTRELQERRINHLKQLMMTQQA